MSRTHARSLAQAFLVLLIAAFDTLGQTAPAVPSGAGYSPVILAVTVNGLSGEQGVVFLQDAAGHLYAPEAFLKAWHLRPGQSRIVAPDGAVHFDLSGIRGLRYRWIHDLEELDISAESEAFLTTRINIGAGSARSVAPYSPGGYLNYDLSSTRAPGLSTYQGLFDVALFRGEGLLTSSFTAGSTGGARLMSTYQTDRVDLLKTLRIGDSVNHTGAWGRGVLFGGVQYGSNFAVRPEFITAAMPRVSGRALLPSTVDIYVNHALRSRQQVDAGPFSILNLPAITGKGEVEVIVKDLLGREQLITQSFFTSPSLLREGLIEDSYEFGWQRQNYGLRSNDYSDPFGALTYRKGLSNRLTGEARLELQKDRLTIGGSAAASLPGISSVIEASLAVSSASGLPPGTMTSADISYLGRRVSASARLQLTSPSFRQIGSDPDHLPRQVGAAQVSTPLGTGTLSVHYLRRLNQGESLTRIVNLNYSQRLAEDMFLAFTLVKPLAPQAGTTIGLMLTMLFDRTHAGSATLTQRPGAASVYTEFQQSTPRDEGTGYRLASLNGSDSSRQEASVTRNQSFGTFQAEVARLNGEISSRLSARGGVAVLGGSMYLSRGLDESFAVVETGDIPGVPVYLENQVVAHTDRHGRAVVSYLRPYERNRLGIDPLTLPMDASVGAYEKTVVPRSRGGTLVDFEVRKVLNATLRIVLADGKPLPALTPVEVIGMDRRFVAGNRGEVAVELPRRKGNRVIARPEGGAVCELTVDMTEAATTVPILGPLVCANTR